MPSCAPNRVVDLTAELDELQRPVLDHLLGKVSASPTCVISDEDALEFICALQSEHLTPERLFHELEYNHLLFISSNFNNWLARLFLRMVKRHRLSDPRDVGEVLADDHSEQDERLMRRLLRNLIDNALKHGRAPVNVSVSELAVDVEISVTDAGHGVVAPELERVFAPFYRSPNTLPGGGAGLGLALVRQIVRHHGGDVQCVARADGASRFVVRPPRLNRS